MRFLPASLFASVAVAMAAPAFAQPAKLDPQTAVYELRTYYAAPGKLEALNTRFRQHTLKMFEKHGMTNVAYWSDLDAPNGRVIYVLAYPSREARDASWKAFGSDPEWRAIASASEANGKLVDKVESVFMKMTDYSPPLPLGR
ncbi:NIPSNAP family protein [Phenylobacterium deserti]|uniref:NIPSNAP family protein n=1 Tax=Phenylobacterium deserti TaxID=1914756 RepID=A0A328AXT8_9CAUL|nr:NIPSNAP family protein [Phenylobacterium deserti]RAK57648.1 NIPSNAP family protein [Phenylobacterium deserti]